MTTDTAEADTPAAPRVSQRVDIRRDGQVLQQLIDRHGEAEGRRIFAACAGRDETEQDRRDFVQAVLRDVVETLSDIPHFIPPSPFVTPENRRMVERIAWTAWESAIHQTLLLREMVEASERFAHAMRQHLEDIMAAVNADLA